MSNPKMESMDELKGVIEELQTYRIAEGKRWEKKYKLAVILAVIPWILLALYILIPVLIVKMGWIH